MIDCFQKCPITFPGALGFSHPSEDLQSTPLRITSANKFNYSNPNKDPKYPNLHISDSYSEVGQMYGDEAMHEEIADNHNVSATTLQPSDTTITLYPINHKLLYQPPSHILNQTTKIKSRLIAVLA